MSLHELHRLMGAVVSNVEALERFLAVLDVLHQDLLLVQHAHTCFLPAARAYLNGKSCADYRFSAARERRARLGGASRWLYHHQKQTFVRLVGMLSWFPIPGFLMDRWWETIKAAEIRLLRDSRRKAAPRPQLGASGGQVARGAGL